MKKLVFFPSDPISAYIANGSSYDYIENYYNPGGYFDEVYCLSPWGDKREETIGKITYIKASPLRFAEIIKKIQPDVVRGYGGYCCADWVSISKVRGIPTLVSVHDTNPALIYDSLKYSDAIVCTAKVVKEAVLARVDISQDRVWIMPNRVDVSLFSHKEDDAYFEKLNQRFGGGKYILHVGRKAEQKNLDTVIKALKYLDSDSKCVFVGRGDTQQYEKLARDCGVEDRCFFIESVPNKELPLWYSWCNCMCTPSRWEGFGIVFIEAAACEAAIVTSNIAPMNEFLTNGVDAILVDEYENPEKMAESIRYALSNNQDVQAFRKAARQVGLRFAKETVDKQEIEIYEKVMSLKANNRVNYRLKGNLLAHSVMGRARNLCKRLIKMLPILSIVV